MAQRTAQKLLIIGWDAADWLIIDALFARGKMPNLRALVERGVRSDLRTLEPKLSPLLWTSIATGKTADKHGILNFVEPRTDGSGLRLSSSTSRRTKAIWNVLSQNALVTNVIGWYASHPAEPIRGSVVSNMLQEGEPSAPDAPWPISPGTVHPPQLASQITAARQRARTFPPDVLARLLPQLAVIPSGDARPATLARLMAYAASIEHAAIVAMTSAPWDCTMVFFDAIDTAGHHFMQYLPPRMPHVSEQDVRLFGDVIPNVYEWHDAALGRLLQAAGPGVTVILLSDHGFHSGSQRPVLVDLPPERRAELESSWHRQLGVLVMSGPGIKPGAAPASPGILDIAPTALALLGVSHGADCDGRILLESLAAEAPPAPIPSWDAVEGDAGLHPPDARQDPFEAVDAIKQLVDLGYMAALPADVQGQLDLVSRESRFNRAVVLMSTHRHADAIAIFHTLAAEKPAESRYVLNLAQCLYLHAEFAACAQALREFLKLDPASIEARLLLAGAIAMQETPTEAAAEIALVERAAQARPELALPLADCLCVMHDFSRASQYYIKARALDSTSTAAHIGLARAQLGLKNYEAAAGHALDALDISQLQPESHYLLGVALTWYGDLENAAKSFELVLQLEPRHIDAHRFLALCAEKSANQPLLQRHQSRVRELSPSAAKLRGMPFGPQAYAAACGLECH